MHLFERLDDVGFIRFVIPEEVFALGEFFFFGMCGVDGLQRVGMKSCVEGLSGDCHGGWGEVLNLFEVEVEFLS